LYVHPQYGGAVATGAGELVMGTCSTFLAVELMRRGASPLDAASLALRRIIESYDLAPEHQVAIIAVSPKGQFASAALRRGYKTSVHDGRRSEVVEPDAIELE
jgi:N4-(beta-N-acetylglucosaminyl)-L-asparaginase